MNLFKLKNSKSPIILFGFFYVYSLCTGILFQKIFLKLLPGMVAPGATLTTDSEYFHRIAIDLANEIHRSGWGIWSFFPNEYTSFNVAIVGALYAAFGVNSLLAVPLNALFHALSGVLLYFIAVEISKNEANGKVAGLIVSILFVIFPSALNWYGQIHKDGFVIFGIFAYIYVLVVSLKKYRFFSYKDIVKYSILSFSTLFFIGIVRPYYLKPLLLFSLILLAFSLWRGFIKSDQSKNLITLSILTVISVAINNSVVVAIGATEAQLGETYASSDSLEFNKKEPRKQGTKHGSCGSFGTLCQMYSEFEEQVTIYYLAVEERIENNAKILAETRFKLNEYSKSVNSNSSIDVNINFHGIGDIISYIPRALQISIFAPFPSNWLSSLSPTRLLAVGEMAIIYLALLGLPLAFLYNAKTESVFILGFSLIFLVIYGLTIGNVGTLYRVRYAFEFILVLLGIVGWCDRLMIGNVVAGRLKFLSRKST